MPRMLSLLIVALTATIALPLNALAQTNTNPKAEFAVGYSFLRALEGEGTNFPTGWLASVSSFTTDWFSVVGEVAGSYKSYDDRYTMRLHSFQAGVRVSSRTSGAARPFAHFLLGGVNARGYDGSRNIASKTYFSIEPGGGLDLPVNGPLSVRMAGTFPMIFSNGDVGNTFRLNVGVVIGVGKR